MESWQDEIIKAQISQEIGVEMSMENSDISAFLKSFKESLLSAVDRDSFDKSWSSDLQSKFPNGSWRTVNGARVFINNGKVVAGLDGFNGEIDKFFEGRGKKEGENKKEDKGIKVKRKFDYNGSEIRIVEREEDRGDGQTWKPIRVLAPNGDTILVNIEHKETLRSIEDKTRKLLDDMKKRGLDVDKGLAKKEVVRESQKPEETKQEKPKARRESKSSKANKRMHSLEGYKSSKTDADNSDSYEELNKITKELDPKLMSSKDKESEAKLIEEIQENFWSPDDSDRSKKLSDVVWSSNSIKESMDAINKLQRIASKTDYSVLDDKTMDKVKGGVATMLQNQINKKETERLNYKLF